MTGVSVRAIDSSKGITKRVLNGAEDANARTKPRRKNAIVIAEIMIVVRTFMQRLMIL